MKNSLNPDNYRKEVWKKFEESRHEEEEAEEVVEQTIPLGSPTGGALDELRSKLFKGEESVADREANDEEFEGEMEVPGDEAGDLDMPPVEIGDEELDGVDDLEGEEDFDGEPDMSMDSSQDHIEDVITDTIDEVLVSIKNVRDKYKSKADDRKADIVRRIHAYLTKSRDKIAKEVREYKEDPAIGGQPQQQMAQQPQQIDVPQEPPIQ